MTPRELIGRRQSCYFANSQSSVSESGLRDDVGGGGGGGCPLVDGAKHNAEFHQNGRRGGDILSDGISGNPNSELRLRSDGKGGGLRHISGIGLTDTLLLLLFLLLLLLLLLFLLLLWLL